jgi:glutaredoxin
MSSPYTDHVTKSILEKGITIFTKSNCSFCKKAKALLTDWEIDAHILYCDTFLQTDRTGFLESIHEIAAMPEGTIKTFPMIFFDGAYIGGYTELKNKYDITFLF